jgi:hypothetical protein
MEQATLRRTTGGTRLNERSSRSHAYLHALILSSPDASGLNNELAGWLRNDYEVDFCGSRRIGAHQGNGVVEFEESININKDLFVLGKVVAGLEKAKKGRGARRTSHRDSKLT